MGHKLSNPRTTCFGSGHSYQEHKIWKHKQKSPKIYVLLKIKWKINCVLINSNMYKSMCMKGNLPDI